jgi:hypothetical protein
VSRTASIWTCGANYPVAVKLGKTKGIRERVAILNGGGHALLAQDLPAHVSHQAGGGEIGFQLPAPGVPYRLHGFRKTGVFIAAEEGFQVNKHRVGHAVDFGHRCANGDGGFNALRKRPQFSRIQLLLDPLRQRFKGVGHPPQNPPPDQLVLVKAAGKR